jgi:hypothetical protein
MRMILPPVTRTARPLPRLPVPPGRSLLSRPFLPKGEPPFSDDEPNSNPLSVVTLSCSPATCPASSATRSFSLAFSARSSSTSASARSARARQ